jgi:tetratricopeptide (TPR) repeat protein
MIGRSRTAAMLAVIAALLVLAALLDSQRDRLAAAAPAHGSDLLYIQSPGVVRKMALSYDSALADVYWMRALQHYGYYRLHRSAPERYRLLYPLLDLTTTLDPRFIPAYRFGAIFLAEPDPGGAGRPDLAVKLLEKGVALAPQTWQYYHDIGFVYYWHLNDYRKAAEWFERGGEVPGSPWWLRTYAGVMLSRGGDRQASRALWQNLLLAADNSWVRQSAQLRLAQLDALDQIVTLDGVRERFERRYGRHAGSWDELIRAGLLRGVPLDPSGAAYAIDSATGEISVSTGSKLYPLPSGPTQSGR